MEPHRIINTYGHGNKKKLHNHSGILEANINCTTVLNSNQVLKYGYKN
jgi:hypothetical protein